jgi:hypothetical protein
MKSGLATFNEPTGIPVVDNNQRIRTAFPHTDEEKSQEKRDMAQAQADMEEALDEEEDTKKP